MRFIDFFGIIGGIQAALSVLFATIVAPFSQHSFILTALKTLFVV